LRVLRNLGLLSRVARHYGVPPIQIGRRALYLYRHHNFGFQDAMRCGLLDPNLPDAAAFGCIRRADITPIQNRHNRVEWKCLTEDKAVFYSFCGHAGIPAPEMLAVVGKAGGRTVKGASPSSRAEWERYFANDLPAEFVVKPTLGAHGKGFRLYRRDAADFSASVLYDRLTKSTEWDNFVIQRRIRSHSDIVQLTGSEALQTARIITWVTPQGDIDVYLTFFRIVVGANFYDNYNYGLSGNLIANIDPASGRLTTATGASPNGIGFSVLTSHPKTGAPFADFQLPHWQEARKLAEHAAMLFLPLRTIGWDLALTDDGPLLLEGNAEWDPVNHLVVHAGPEHQLELADFLNRLRAA
jgi:putative polysaccharide biosynthesis protein